MVLARKSAMARGQKLGLIIISTIAAIIERLAISVEIATAIVSESEK